MRKIFDVLVGEVRLSGNTPNALAAAQERFEGALVTIDKAKELALASIEKAVAI